MIRLVQQGIPQRNKNWFYFEDSGWAMQGNNYSILVIIMANKF